MHTSIGYHFLNEGLSDRRLDRIAHASTLDDALAGRGLLDKIIDYFRGGVKYEEISRLFDMVQAAKAQHRLQGSAPFNPRNVTQAYGGLRIQGGSTDLTRIEAFKWLRSLVKPEYLSKFDLNIQADQSGQAWSYSILIDGNDIYSSPALSAGVELEKALGVQKGIFIQQDLPILAKKMIADINGQFDDPEYKRKYGRVLFSELSQDQLSRVTDYNSAKAEGLYFADQLADLHKIQGLSQDEQSALIANFYNVKDDVSYSSSKWLGIKDCNDGSFIFEFEGFDSLRPLELKLSDRGGATSFPEALNGGTLRKLLLEEDYSSMLSFVEGTMYNPEVDGGFMAPAAATAMASFYPGEDQSALIMERVAFNDAIVSKDESLHNVVDNRAVVQSLEFSILSHKKIADFILCSNAIPLKQRLCSLDADIRAAIGNMEIRGQVSMNSLLDYAGINRLFQ